MKFKTSLYLDEGIDRRIDERSKQKQMSKSSVFAEDFDRFYMCLDLGRKEYKEKLKSEIVSTVMNACSVLSGNSARSNFIITGAIQSIHDKTVLTAINTLTPIARLAILDDTELINR